MIHLGVVLIMVSMLVPSLNNNGMKNTRRISQRGPMTSLKSTEEEQRKKYQRRNKPCTSARESLATILVSILNYHFVTGGISSSQCERRLTSIIAREEIAQHPRVTLLLEDKEHFTLKEENYAFLHKEQGEELKESKKRLRVLMYQPNFLNGSMGEARCFTCDDQCLKRCFQTTGYRPTA